MDATLKPTLWRTCRVLANERRLRLLVAVIQQEGASVSVLAASCGLAPNKATEHLRLLQSRGLLACRRVSRWVLYAAAPDPLVAHAADVLAATRAAIGRQESTAEMVRAFTAFTHPRRIAMVRALPGKPIPLHVLAGRSGMSLPAAVRHADKLRRRGAIVESADGWQLATPTNALLRALKGIALSGR
jgi:DNA-binding transcriptional ArsR family regulator